MPLGTTSGSRAVGVSGRRAMILGTMIPLVGYYTVFLIIPTLYSFAVSFQEYNPITPTKGAFVGLENYRFALFDDFAFWTCVRNTFYYGLIAVPLGSLIAVTLAVLINRVGRFGGVYRVLYFLPVVTSVVAAAIIWNWIYQPRFGLLNTLLEQLYGLVRINLGYPMYLNDVSWAMPSLIVFSVWHGVGFTTVIYLAGLQSIPDQLYEAARIDGAGEWNVFRHITIPLLQPTFLFVLVTGAIGAMQMFTQSYVMTKGGPADATKTMVYLLYDQAFTNFKFGYASSIAFILFAAVLAMTLVQLRFFRTKWEY